LTGLRTGQPMTLGASRRWPAPTSPPASASASASGAFSRRDLRGA